MAFTVEDAATGESLAEAVRQALAARLSRLDRIARHCASLPVMHRRGEAKIPGYDERGLPARVER